MKTVLANLDRRTLSFAAHPFFAYLRDDSVDAQRRLTFVPALSHFVMTFADIYRLVLREEPATDEYQALVNAHTHEDGGHWKWFLADLSSLDQNPRLAFTDTLRFLWSERTANLRMLSYGMCRLGLGASSLHKLVLVQCIEATGSVMLKSVAPLGEAESKRTSAKLVYFGSHHLATESNHTLEQDHARTLIAGIELGSALREELSLLVDEAFSLFTATAAEMFTFAQGGYGFTERA